MIRFLEKRDLPRYLEILGQLSDVGIDIQRAEVLYWYYEKLHLMGVKHTIVSEKDEDIVAIGSIIIEPKFSHGGKNAGHIEDVVVDEPYRNQHYGYDIVRRLLELAECGDCYKVILHCSKHNMPFYEKLGFKHFTGSGELIGMRANPSDYMEIISGSQTKE